MVILASENQWFSHLGHVFFNEREREREREREQGILKLEYQSKMETGFIVEFRSTL